MLFLFCLLNVLCSNTHKTFYKQNKNNNSNIRLESSKSISYQCKGRIQNVEKQKIENNDLQLGLSDKGLNFGHLNIQGICGRDMSKFSEIKAI